MIPIKFFYRYLKPLELILFVILIVTHSLSHFYHLNADKILTRSISKILVINDSDQFFYRFAELLCNNLFYMIIYALTMFFVECLGKLAVKNAVDYSGCNILNADLSVISKKEYEHKVTSIVHHSENITLAIKNIFIEFPRKLITSYYFMLALNDLSVEIMFYCIFSNIIFIIISFGISFVRKKLISKITDNNIKLSIVCSDISHSIQTYKVDNRTDEYQQKIQKLSSSTYIYSSLDSLMNACTDATSSFSGQFMIGLISFTCRPMIFDKSVHLDDILYGIRSSGKFIEKMINVVEYLGDIIRQYKSFKFFLDTEKIISEKKDNVISRIDYIKINKKHYFSIRNNTFPNFIRISGENGIGKTTLLHTLVGTNYLGSKTSGEIISYDFAKNIILPNSYRKYVAFVQQAVPITYDTVEEYIRAAFELKNEFNLDNVLDYFEIDFKTTTHINNFIKEMRSNKIRELSGGQAKMVQIIAAVTKLYYNRGQILALDEPSNNLDRDNVIYLKEIINKCLAKNITIFMVTHDERMVDDKLLTINL